MAQSNIKNVRNVSSMPFISQDKADYLKDQGVEIMNPIDSDPQALFIGKTGNSYGFGYSDKRMNELQQIHSQFKENATPKDINIFSKADTTSYMGSPQETFKNTKKFMQNKNQKIAVFDIETMPTKFGEKHRGILDDTPVQFSFDVGFFDESGMWKSQASKTFDINPDFDYGRVIEDVRKSINRRGRESLSSEQTRSIQRLLRYTDDFEKYVDPDTRRLKRLDENVLQAAEKGLKNLRSKGSPQEVAQAINEFVKTNIDNDTFLAGHNIKSFDIPQMENFLKNNIDDAFSLSKNTYIDTYKIASDLTGSMAQMGRTFNEQAAFAKQDQQTLESFADVFGINISGAGHNADVDVQTSKEVIRKMFFDSDNARGLEKQMNKSFDPTNIKKGDVLFSSFGASGRKTKDVIGYTLGENGIESSEYFIKSQEGYEYLGGFKSGNYTGARIRNLDTGKISVMASESEERIGELFHQRFYKEGNLNEGDMSNFMNKKLDDTAISKWRQIVSGTDKDPYDKLNRFVNAYEKEKEVLDPISKMLDNTKGIGTVRKDRIMEHIKSQKFTSVESLRNVEGVGDATIAKIRQSQAINNAVNFYKEDFDEIFKMGDYGVMGNYPEYYRRLRGRIGGEIDLLRGVRNQVKNQGLEKGFKRNYLTSTILQEAYKEISSNKTNIETPFYRSQGINLTDFFGNQRFISTSGKSRGSISGFIKGQANKWQEIAKEMQGFNPVTGPQTQVAQMFRQANRQLEREFNLQNQLLNIRDNINVSPASARDDLLQFIKSNQDLMPTSFNAKLSISELEYGEDPRRIVNNLFQSMAKQQGLDESTPNLLDRKTFESFKNQSQNLINKLETGKNVNISGIAKSYEDLYREHYSSGMIFSNKGVVRDYSLNPRRDIKGVNNVIEKASKRGTEKLKQLNIGAINSEDKSFLFDSAHKNQLTTTVDYLDHNLNTVYEQLNLGRRPVSMKDTLEKLNTQLSSSLSQDTSYSVYFSGGVDDPTVTLGLFKKGNEAAVVGKSLSELKESRVRNKMALIDIPLISKDQYLRVGNRKITAPGAILDLKPNVKPGSKLDPIGSTRVMNAFEAVVGNAFGMDYADNRGRNKLITRLDDLVQADSYKQVERRITKNMNKAVNGLAGTMGPKSYSEDIRGFSSGYRGDWVRKRSISASKVFTDEQGMMYDIDGNIVMPKPYKEGQRSSLDFFGSKEPMRFVEKALRGAKISVGGTRDKHMSQHVYSTADPRDMLAFGQYTNPARPNIHQVMNIREFTDRSIEEFYNNNIRTQVDFTTMQDYVHRSLHGDHSVQARVAIATDLDLFSANGRGLSPDMSLMEIIKEYGTDEEKRMFKDANDNALIPSLTEDQMIVASDVLEPYESTFARKRTFEGKLELNSTIKKAIDEKGFYKLDYQEEIGTLIGEDGVRRKQLNPYKAGRRITGYDIGDTTSILQEEEIYTASEGMTKMYVGTEKGTLRNSFSRDVMKHWMGDVDAVIGPGHKSHMNYGDIIEGLTRQSVRNINESDLSRATKEAELQKIQDIIRKNFGMSSRQVYKQANNTKDKNTAQLMLLLDPSGGKGEIEPGILGREGSVFNEIDNVLRSANIKGLDKDILNLNLAFAKDDENLHYLSFGKNPFGKKGAKFSMREVSFLNDSGFGATADYLEKRITEDGLAGSSKLGRRTKSMRYMLGQTYDDFSHLRDELNRRIKSGEVNLLEAYKLDKDYTFVGKNFVNDAGESEYRYIKDTLESTFIGSSRGETVLELPGEITVDVGSDKQAVSRSLDRVYMSSSDPITIHDKKSKAVMGDLNKRQYRVAESTRDWQLALTDPEEARKRGIIGVTDSKGNTITTESLRERTQDNVQEYFDYMRKEVFTKRGTGQEDVLGARLRGSGRARVQIMSPGLEFANLDDSAIERLVSETTEDLTAKEFNQEVSRIKGLRNQVVKTMKKTGIDSVDDPMTAYISEQKARSILKGNEYADDIIEKLQKGGHSGIIEAHPTIHPTSVMPINFKVAQDLNEDTVRMSATMADFFFRDSDGDNISFALVGEVDDEEIQKNIAEARRLVSFDPNNLSDNKLRGTTSGIPQLNVFKDMIGDFDKPKGIDVFDYLESEDKMLRQFKGEATEDLIIKSKLNRGFFTGMISNISDQYRRMGLNYLSTEEERMALRTGLGNIIEGSISSKHILDESVLSTEQTTEAISTAGGKAGVARRTDPEEVISILQNTSSASYVEDIAKLGPEGMELISESEVSALTKVAQQGGEDYGKMMNEIIQGEKALKETMPDLMNKLKSSSEMVPSDEVEFYRKNVLSQIDNMLGAKLPGKKEQLRQQREMFSPSAAPKRALKNISGALKPVTEGIAKHSPVGFKAGAGMALGIGIIGGAMMTSDNALPMDSFDDPGMRPVGNTAGRSTSAQLQPGFTMNMLDEPIERSANRMDLGQSGGYNVSVSGSTTMDRSSEELAQVVQRAIEESQTVPLNINVRTNDNRNQLSDKWIEDQILNII